jgi:hypothetical protein
LIAFGSRTETRTDERGAVLLADQDRRGGSREIVEGSSRPSAQRPGGRASYVLQAEIAACRWPRREATHSAVPPLPLALEGPRSCAQPRGRRVDAGRPRPGARCPGTAGIAAAGYHLLRDPGGAPRVCVARAGLQPSPPTSRPKS